MWHRCRSSIDTAYWLIMNDYDIYKLTDEYCIEDDRVIDTIKAEYFISNEDWEGLMIAIEIKYTYIFVCIKMRGCPLATNEMKLETERDIEYNSTIMEMKNIIKKSRTSYRRTVFEDFEYKI